MSLLARPAASSTAFAFDWIVTRDRGKPRERRISAGRRSVELLLDTAFRPGRWAARASRALGLQGRITVRTDRVSLPHPAPRRPIRVAFASDFHAGATTDPRVLRDACRALSDMNPDLLLLGGDFVSVRAAYITELAPLLTTVHAAHGCFAVFGNHDLRANAEHIASELSSRGISLIVNRRVSLTIQGTEIALCGLDDSIAGQPRGDVLDGGSGIRLVLMHSPDGLLSIGERPFDVALCGHTHGGQIAAPGGFPLLLPHGRLNRRFPSGRFELPTGAGGKRRLLIVSRGVGCSTLPIRLFAPPEVHLVIIE